MSQTTRSKPYGGKIKDWSLHTLSNGKSIITGIVVEDRLGRFEEGWFIKTSLIVNLDRDKGLAETLNTLYRLENEIESDPSDLIPYLCPFMSYH